MIDDLHRRRYLLAAASLPLAACSSWASGNASSEHAQFAQLENAFDGRIGVFALDTNNGAHFAYRAAERFPMNSTFKAILAGAILERSARTPGLLRQRIDYGTQDLVTYSPVAQRHLATGMTVAEACAGAVQYSDNTCANLLMKLLGGPAAVTAFARTIGDREFRLDRWETELNTAIPGDARDTTTPEAMARSLQRLVLGDALPEAQRMQLRDRLLGNTTGAERIRAGVPADWQVGDKTGSGDYGSAHDIAVLWPPRRAPVVLAVYTTRRDKNAKARSDVVAAAARIAIGAMPGQGAVSSQHLDVIHPPRA